MFGGVSMYKVVIIVMGVLILEYVIFNYELVEVFNVYVDF